MLIFDGSYALHRVLTTNALYDLQNSTGIRTGGIHGFLMTVNTVVKYYKGTKGVIITWDQRDDIGASHYRNGIFPDYKGGPGVHPSINKMLDNDGKEWQEVYLWTRRMLHTSILPLMDTISVQCQGIEADDIISWIVNNINTNSKKVVVTNDSDLLQVLNDNTEYYNPRNHKVTTKEDFIKNLQLIPEKYKEQYIMMEAIMGTHNGIPGINGLGEVWSRKISKIILEDGEDALDPSITKHKSYLDNKDLVKFNIPLIDLDQLPQTEKDRIKEQVNQHSQFKLNQSSEDILLEKLHSLELKVAKKFALNIIDANIKSDIKVKIKNILNKNN